MNIVYENRTTALSYSIGENLSSTAHLHKELELVYIIDGKAMAYADKNNYLLNTGDLFFTFPNQVHYYETLKKGTYLVLIFSSSVIYGVGAEISKSVPDMNYIPAGNKEITDCFNNIFNLSGEYKNLAANGYLNLAMSMILPRLKLTIVSGGKNSTFNSIVDFCSRNFREDITLDYLAESLHLSKYYISHLINKKLHQSFSDYINNLRIAEACNILKETDKKIADISEDVGFGTIRSFNRSFKQIMGVSPAEYRSKLAELKKSI